MKAKVLNLLSNKKQLIFNTIFGNGHYIFFHRPLCHSLVRSGDDGASASQNNYPFYCNGAV